MAQRGREEQRGPGGGCQLSPAVPTCGLIVVDADPVQLQVAVPVVGARGVDAVLVTDHLPELWGHGDRARGQPSRGSGAEPGGFGRRNGDLMGFGGVVWGKRGRACGGGSSGATPTLLQPGPDLGGKMGICRRKIGILGGEMGV